jgi:NDP-sugar pyrophosphorylase family protein
MLLDADLGALVERHRVRRDAVTMLLRDDPRTANFGSVGVDSRGAVRRIGTRFDLGGESACGVYTWVNVVAARALDTLPHRERFSHFDDWIAPLLSAGARDVRGEIASADAIVWEPVGTLAEYLEANLHPPSLSYIDPDTIARANGARFASELVIGAGATIAAGASLCRAIVWDGESVSAITNGSDGVFAGGRFIECIGATDARPTEGTE